MTGKMVAYTFVQILFIDFSSAFNMMQTGYMFSTPATASGLWGEGGSCAIGQELFN